MYYYWVCGTQSLVGSTLFFWVIKHVIMVEGMDRNVVISERLLLSILGIHHTITLLWYVTYGMSLISDHDHVYMLCLMRIDSMWSIIWSASFGLSSNACLLWRTRLCEAEIYWVSRGTCHSLNVFVSALNGALVCDNLCCILAAIWCITYGAHFDVHQVGIMCTCCGDVGIIIDCSSLLHYMLSKHSPYISVTCGWLLMGETFMAPGCVHVMSTW